MRTDRRLTRLVIVAALVATPAAALRFFCIGNTCVEDELSAEAATPFCPLPADLRQLVSDGYNQARSPELFMIASDGAQVRGNDPAGPTGAAPVWPTLDAPAATRIPIAFMGPGAGKPLRGAAPGLEDVGPTLAAMIGFDRWPFPDERTGTSLLGTKVGDPAPLGLIIAWKGVGSDELENSPGSWPYLKDELIRSGSGTLDATTGALPVDSTASLTTVGTGTLPSKHGVTGTLVRNGLGELAQAWSADAEVAVVNALGDGLDEATGGRSLVGLVATQEFDRGLIGGNWFLGTRDDDDVRIVDADRVVDEVRDLLGRPYGQDDAPDLIGVTLEGDLRDMDRATREIVAAAEESTGGPVAVAMVGTGSAPSPAGDGPAAADIVAAIDEAAEADLSEAVVPGAVFIDQDVLARTGASQSTVIEALRSEETGGRPVFADVFPAFAISFGRYC